jgi:hypothetical protein
VAALALRSCLSSCHHLAELPQLMADAVQLCTVPLINLLQTCTVLSVELIQLPRHVLHLLAQGVHDHRLESTAARRVVDCLHAMRCINTHRARLKRCMFKALRLLALQCTWSYELRETYSRS